MRNNSLFQHHIADVRRHVVRPIDPPAAQQLLISEAAEQHVAVELIRQNLGCGVRGEEIREGGEEHDCGASGLGRRDGQDIQVVQDALGDPLHAGKEVHVGGGPALWQVIVYLLVFSV